MSNNDQATQLQQDVQQELVTATQLLQLIAKELEAIKKFTDSGGDFEKNIKENATLIEKMAVLQQIDLTNLPKMKRKLIDLKQLGNQNEHSGIDESH